MAYGSQPGWLPQLPLSENSVLPPLMGSLKFKFEFYFQYFYYPNLLLSHELIKVKIRLLLLLLLLFRLKCDFLGLFPTSCYCRSKLALLQHDLVLDVEFNSVE